ncbi:MAG: phage capsid protein [Geminicoccaceae bacterium]
MATDVSDAFVKQFEREAHLVYQRMGSKLRSTVRFKGDVEGSSTTFQKIGKGIATTKARHAQVNPMNVDHTPIEVTLSDHYAPDYIDKLDEDKITHDERTALVNTGAWALGRKTDELITDQLDLESDSGGGSAAWTLARARDMVTALFENDVEPMPNRVFGVVGWDEWKIMMSDSAFASSDFVGDHPLKMFGEVKTWHGVTWCPFNGLPLSGSDRSVFAYDKMAIGHASGHEIETEINYVPERAAFLVNSLMSQGAKVIDSTGVIKFLADES